MSLVEHDSPQPKIANFAVFGSLKPFLRAKSAHFLRPKRGYNSLGPPRRHRRETDSGPIPFQFSPFIFFALRFSTARYARLKIPAQEHKTV